MKKKEILFIHGTDYKNMTKKLLERANLAGAIPHRDTKIALKPNLVAAQDASNGATTHWELAAGSERTRVFLHFDYGKLLGGGEDGPVCAGGRI